MLLSDDNWGGRKVSENMLEKQPNIDRRTVDGFGEEWTRFDQTDVCETELKEIFASYFRIFPWHLLPENAVGYDLGCGTGRWAKYVAPRVGHLHCIDASAKALEVAKRNLREFTNCEFALASVESLPLEDGAMDFGYSLGVLHHVPNTAVGIKSCVSKLKPDAPFLLYLYYAFDNRPAWFRLLWHSSDLIRRIISRSPFWLKYCLSQAIAVFVYYPLARFACLLEMFGINVDMFLLSFYRRRSFYTMRTDALDRFGTRLEQRFTARQIQGMMEEAGLS